MNRSEVADLLALIEGFERRPFPANAVDAWLAVMARVEYRDAAQAVTEAFDTAEPLKTPVQPANAIARIKSGSSVMSMVTAALHILSSGRMAWQRPCRYSRREPRLLSTKTAYGWPSARNSSTTCPGCRMRYGMRRPSVAR